MDKKTRELFADFFARSCQNIKYVLFKEVKIGRIKIQVEWRKKSNFWGRFGGGWNWHVGIQAGGRSIIISLLVLMIYISIHREQNNEKSF